MNALEPKPLAAKVQSVALRVEALVLTRTTSLVIFVLVNVTEGGAKWRRRTM